MTSGDAIRAAMRAHVAAVGAADAGALAALYAPTAGCTTPPAVNRSSVARRSLNTRIPSERRDVQILTVSVTGLEAAVHFRATPAGVVARDVIDTMTFDDQVMIVAMRVYAD